MRPRNAAGTRDAILQAARVAFTHHSFDQIGIREITGAAGVNGSLVNRYFGTKERLFAEVMESGRGFELFDDEITFDRAIASLADRALQRTVDRSAFDPILALIRSAPIEKAQPVLRDYLAQKVIIPLASLIGGDHANERASLIVAFLIGVITVRAVIKSDPLASTTRNDLANLTEGAVRCVASPEVVSPGVGSGEGRDRGETSAGPLDEQASRRDASR